MNKLSNLPPKGTSDWMPEDFGVRKYIFDTWRKVCLSFGYEEYLTPLVEYAEVYRAKSGEDVGGKELTTFMDRGGRELAIRPEMTPSVTRMVSRIYGNSPKPIRLFSIANFMRNEKPQKGRNREFWQLNVDIFGAESNNADFEILQLALEIMKAFNAPEGSFNLYINNRKLIDFVLNDILSFPEQNRSQVLRILDKWQKLEKGTLVEALNELGLDDEQITKLDLFMQSKNDADLLRNLPEVKSSQGYIEINELIEKLNQAGYAKYTKFNPSVVRGFDYYDGMIFEVFDNNTENKRSMFGGGRYNGLANLFGSESFPAVGFAPGDETTKIFLENWNLVPKDLQEPLYYLPILSSNLLEKYTKLAQDLRVEGKRVILGLDEQKLTKSLDFANKSDINFVVLFGEDEESRGEYVIKNMTTGEQLSFKL